MIQQGMARRQAEEALEVDVRDLRLDIRRSLTQDSSGQHSLKRENRESRRGPRAVRGRSETRSPIEEAMQNVPKSVLSGCRKPGQTPGRIPTPIF